MPGWSPPRGHESATTFPSARAHIGPNRQDGPGQICAVRGDLSCRRAGGRNRSGIRRETGTRMTSGDSMIRHRHVRQYDFADQHAYQHGDLDPRGRQQPPVRPRGQPPDRHRLRDQPRQQHGVADHELATAVAKAPTVTGNRPWAPRVYALPGVAEEPGQPGVRLSCRRPPGTERISSGQTGRIRSGQGASI